MDILYNFEESRDIFVGSFLQKIEKLKSIKIFNVTDFTIPLAGCAGTLESLFIGFNEPMKGGDWAELKLPHLKILEISGFELMVGRFVEIFS